MYEDRKHRVSGLLGGWRGRLVRGSALLAAALCLYHLSALAAISTSVTISNNIIRALAYDARLSWQQKGEADWTVLTNDNGNGEISGQISVTFASPNRRSMPIPSPARAPMQETVETPDSQIDPEIETAPEAPEHDEAQGSPEDSQDIQDIPDDQDGDAEEEESAPAQDDSETGEEQAEQTQAGESADTQEASESETQMEPNEAPPMRFGPQGLEYEVVFSVKIENGGRADVPFRYSLRLDDLPDDVEIVSIKTGNNEELTAVTSDGKYVLVKDQDIIPETKHTYEVTLRSTMTKTIDLSFVLEHGFLPVQQDGKWVGDAQGNP